MHPRSYVPTPEDFALLDQMERSCVVIRDRAALRPYDAGDVQYVPILYVTLQQLESEIARLRDLLTHA